MSLGKQIEITVQLMQDLIEILDFETQNIQKISSKEMDLILKKKQLKIHQYEAAIKSLLNNQEQLKLIPEPVKKVINDQQSKLNQSIKENSLRVRANMEAIDKVLSIIREKVFEFQNEAGIYHKSSRSGAGVKDLSQSSKPITYNEQL